MAAAATTAIAAPAPAAADRIDPRRLFAFLAMVFGMFMAILDIQIVSASLAEIQAGLAASADEISWVQTSYLIAEVVMIPLSGFLGRVLSTRYLFALAAAGFTVSSALCATATSIEQMIVYRALQGFIGGGMIPSVFAAAFTIFPPRRRAAVSALIGLVATLAPTIGPTVGGYLSNALSWHWLFLVNILPGIGVSVATFLLIDFDKPNFPLMRRFDWLGLAGMALFLGSLEYVLEEGPNHDWFDETSVFVMAWICAGGALLFFWRALSQREPIVDLTAFANRNFALGCAFSFVMGIGLYGLTYVYPLYLARVRGYDALMIGETMFVTGLCMFFMAPVAGRLSQKIDPRLMMMGGFIGFAGGTYLASGITVDWDFNELLWPQVLRGVSLMMCMVPINNLSLGTLAPETLKNASGLYNLTRNLGGAVGLAVINTVLNNRMDLHISRLHERVAWGRTVAEETYTALVQRFSGALPDPDGAALRQMVSLARRQAQVMAFGDVFLLLTGLFASLALFAVLMRKPKPLPPAAASGH